MKIFDVPAIWSSPKFAARYGLDYHTDYYLDGEGKLKVLPDWKITDDPPIFEVSDPFVDKYGALKLALDGYKAPPAIDVRMLAIVTEWRKVLP